MVAIESGRNEKRLSIPIEVPVTKGEKVTENVLLHDPSLCTGCMQCMIGCAYAHFKTYDLTYGLLYVNENPAKVGQFVNANCTHCVYPMCLAACPKEAIYKDDLGIVRISPLRCIGCGICAQACPIAIPRLDNEKKIYVKCDLCNGEPPNCVKMCTPNAIVYLPREEAFERMKKIRGV
jgi:Fe-S-cluster-containing dehydrogenase component